MPNDPTEHQKLIEALNDATRRQSTWTVLFHNTVAGQVGLNITDHKCLDILIDRGPLTAGQMAEITHLTSGAVTGVIDRLEKAGYVQRGYDQNDRRKVIIHPVLPKAEQEFGPLFSHFQERFLPLLAGYKDEDLRLVLRFVEESIAFMQEEISWLRKES